MPIVLQGTNTDKIKKNVSHNQKQQRHHSNQLLINTTINNTVKPVLRGHLSDKEKLVLLDRWPLKRGSIHMKFSITGEEQCDLLIQVTS